VLWTAAFAVTAATLAVVGALTENLVANAMFAAVTALMAGAAFARSG
jgi:hypothetical protein